MNRRTLLGAFAALTACAALVLLPGLAHADTAPAPAAKTAKKAPAKKAMAKKGKAKMAKHAMAAKAKKAPKAHAYTGEVLDLDCFLEHGAHGAKHAACAMGCLKKGAPAGLLLGKEAWLLIGENPHLDAYQAVRGMAAKRVTVMGHKVWRHGFRAIIVEGVKGT